MLFNSYEFIFIFLPFVLAGFFLLESRYRIGFLTTASFVFYIQWSMVHCILLLSSVLLNYLFTIYMARTRHKSLVLTAAILINLLPLIYFKYSLFLHLSTESLVLPLAISFYTFQQIAFLVDTYREKIQPGSFAEYLFFVIFFPQLIAGPIVHYRQIIVQVENDAFQNVKWAYIQSGIVLFSLGLFKKVVLADQLFPIATAAFSDVDSLSSLGAWIGLMAYSLGIYFDFSGYTDMAIGLALLFGLRLPINFNSPYKAVNIVDFWRRWHITLSDFLKEYIYIPLGGNRKGEYREVSNLIITMGLGGVWHGAGWTFIVWGLMHGLFLAVVHLKNCHFSQWHIPRSAAIFITFITVSLLWVLFRSHNMGEAWAYYTVLFSFSGDVSMHFYLYWISIGLVIVWFLPNSTDFAGYKEKMKSLHWKHALLSGVLAVAALKMMAESPAQTFVYFNF